MTLFERVEKIRVEIAGKNIATFTNLISFNASSYRTLLSKESVNVELLEKILSTYPDLSAEWLMRGNGDMYLPSPILSMAGSHADSGGASAPTSSPKPYALDDTEGAYDLSSLLSELSLLRSQNQQLLDIISNLTAPASKQESPASKQESPATAAV